MRPFDSLRCNHRHVRILGYGVVTALETGVVSLARQFGAGPHWVQRTHKFLRPQMRNLITAGRKQHHGDAQLGNFAINLDQGDSHIHGLLHGRD